MDADCSMVGFGGEFRPRVRLNSGVGSGIRKRGELADLMYDEDEFKFSIVRPWLNGIMGLFKESELNSESVILVESESLPEYAFEGLASLIEFEYHAKRVQRVPELVMALYAQGVTTGLIIAEKSSGLIVSSPIVFGCNLKHLYIERSSKVSSIEVEVKKIICTMILDTLEKIDLHSRRLILQNILILRSSKGYDDWEVSRDDLIRVAKFYPADIRSVASTGPFRVEVVDDGPLCIWSGASIYGCVKNDLKQIANTATATAMVRENLDFRKRFMSAQMSE